jgi:hypothetical protein
VKPKPPPKPRFFPPRTLGQLMILVALCGLALAVVVPREDGQGAGPRPSRGRLGSLRLRPALAARPALPFRVPGQTATGEDAMVLAAPAGIDDAFTH